MPTIHLTDETHRELGRFGTRDESWDTIISRVLRHTDEKTVLEGLRNRKKREADVSHTTSAENYLRHNGGTNYSKEEGHPALRELENGTQLRHQFKQGDYAGETVQAKVRDGHVVYNSKWMAPSTAAVEAVEDIKGEPHRINGWRWWEYLNDESNEWRSIDELRD